MKSLTTGIEISLTKEILGTSGVETNNLALETSDDFLLETGDKITLEN